MIDENGRIRYLCTYQHYNNFEPGLIDDCVVWARCHEDAAKAAAKYFECDWRYVTVDDEDIHEEKVEYDD